MTTAADNMIAKTEGYVANEAGVGFYNDSLLIPMVNTQYSDEYGKKSGGARVGNTIRVKFPAQFITTSGVALSSSTVQAIVQDTKVLVLDKREGIHMELDTEQVTLEIEAKGSTYSEEVLQPAGSALRAKIEADGFDEIALKAQNVIVMETPYADTALLRKSFVKARAMLDKQLAPKGDRFCILDSDTEVEAADSVLDLYHATSEIEKAYKEGKMGTFGGLLWGCSDLVTSRVNGGGGLVTSVSAFVDGASEITLTAVTGIVVGDKIEISLKAVNPETKKAYANNIQRAVLAIDGSVITIDPIYSIEQGGRANVYAADASAIVGAAVTVLGTAGETYVACPVFQKKGITLGSADLFLPNNVEMKKRNKVHNVSFRFIRDYLIGSDTLPSRLEALYTWDLIRPEFVAVVELKIS